MTVSRQAPANLLADQIIAEAVTCEPHSKQISGDRPVGRGRAATVKVCSSSDDRGLERGSPSRNAEWTYAAELSPMIGSMLCTHLPT